MTQLKTEQEYKFGQKNVLPIVGEIQISNEGIIEVETTEIAQQIEDLEIGFTIVGKKVESTTTTTLTESTTTTTVKVEEIKPKVEVDNLSGTDKKVDTIAPQTTESTVLDTTTTEQTTQAPSQDLTLESLTVDKLRELAAPFPKEEWNALKKAELVTYLKTQLEKAK